MNVSTRIWLTLSVISGLSIVATVVFVLVHLHDIATDIVGTNCVADAIVIYTRSNDGRLPEDWRDIDSSLTVIAISHGTTMSDIRRRVDVDWKTLRFARDRDSASDHTVVIASRSGIKVFATELQIKTKVKDGEQKLLPAEL